MFFLFIDGEPIKYAFPDALEANYYLRGLDWEAGVLPAGRHTFEIRCDHTYQVSESNETNNIYSRTFDITHRPTEKPIINSFSINNNAVYTTDNIVILNNAADNEPIEYMASENPNFIGAKWLDYSESPKFTLSSGSGKKTVYFKIQNADNEFDQKIDGIYYLPDWEIVKYAQSTAAIGIVTINGTPASQRDIIAAFVDGECRGTGRVYLINADSVEGPTAHVLIMHIYGDDKKDINFKLFDISEDLVMDIEKHLPDKSG